MKRFLIVIAAMLFAASAVYAQEAEEGMAEDQAAAEADAAAPAEAEVADTSKLYRENTDPDRYKEPIKWGVNPLIKQIHGDHSLGLLKNDPE